MAYRRSMAKGDRLLPMALEFAHLLEAVPESERSGPVFQLERSDGKPD